MILVSLLFLDKTLINIIILIPKETILYIIFPIIAPNIPNFGLGIKAILQINLKTIPIVKLIGGIFTFLKPVKWH